MYKRLNDFKETVRICSTVTVTMAVICTGWPVVCLSQQGTEDLPANRLKSSRVETKNSKAAPKRTEFQAIIERKVRLSTEFRTILSEYVESLPNQTSEEKSQRTSFDKLLKLAAGQNSKVTLEDLAPLFQSNPYPIKPIKELTENDDPVLRFIALTSLVIETEDRGVATKLLQLKNDKSLDYEAKTAIDLYFIVTNLEQAGTSAEELLRYIRSSKKKSTRDAAETITDQCTVPTGEKNVL